MKSPFKFYLFAVILIIIDQAIKLWMHFEVIPNHFGEIDLIPGFLKLHYITNKGMAFGMELGGDYGKLILTAFRLVAMGVIVYILAKLARKGSPDGLLWSLGAILAGAIGNVVDSIFYGVFLNNAPFDAPSPWFHGQVIDMFYAYGLDGYWPDWVPFLGGTYNNTPIFNFADACIFVGVVTILIFQKSFIDQPLENSKNEFQTAIESDYDNEEN
ncbi:lipoprotein signal peptidase [Jiulongibacter sediminis]|uniref:Lipoprotein signal peptidase n=1 Tax=Jiulongibacter sediminis TaxID=1605367 RepID=A0A0P7BF85_9BACT|nr:lipoprotein signal peptidase [Jiulongibacter sediminis]KPM49509.1 signal peptidase [Jiulongibacter sediminis]